MDDSQMHAGMRPDELRNLHREFDQNKDGKVSLAEIMDFAHSTAKAMATKDVAGMLEQLDADGDGYLSLQEHLATSEGEGDAQDLEVEKTLALETAKFKAADADGDGLLNPQEMTSLFYIETSTAVLDVAVQETSKLKDKNKDGVLNVKEFLEIGPEHAGEKISEEEMRIFRHLDKDENGVLDAAELRTWESGAFETEAAMMTVLQEADKDGDQHASIEEFENVHHSLAGTIAQYHFIEWVQHHEL